MKYRMLALILAVTVVSWAQTATQSTPSTPQTPEKSNGACCDKMAASDAKDAHAACMGNHDGKEMASCCAGEDAKSCCGGKDAKACMKDGKMADYCKGKDGMKCDRKAGKDCGKGCCGSSKNEKPA
jgi:hypothetical protein